MAEKRWITVKVDGELHRQVKEYIETHGMTMSDFVSQALEEMSYKAEHQSYKEKIAEIGCEIADMYDTQRRQPGFSTKNARHRIKKHHPGITDKQIPDVLCDGRIIPGRIRR